MSVINLYQKYIFVHIPKTGGTSIEAVIGGNGHMGVEDFASMLDQNDDLCWDDFFSFAYVRNPYERLVSTYAFINKGMAGFEQTIASKLSNSGLYRPQNLFTHINSTSSPITIFRYENLDSDWGSVCKKLGWEKTILPHKRKSNHLHWSQYYNNQLKKEVLNFYQDDFRIFGYEH